MTASSRQLRVVVCSHSHPERTKGGAETAAFRLFQELGDRQDCEVWFIGCDASAAAVKPGAVFSQPYTEREYIYGGSKFDWFKFANSDHRFPSEMERLLASLSPQIVHFHHYANFGVEVFAHVKRAAPQSKTILTLHEYLAICHHFGQMVTKPHRNLCYRSSAMRCCQCFPEFDKSDFFLRKRYIERFFDLVDGFVAPSQFLLERYTSWGLPPERMTVIENPVSRLQGKMTYGAGGTLPLRLGFFGQISTLKGIDVVLDAAQLLLEQGRLDVIFEIHGEYRGQPREFQEVFLERLKKIGQNVRFHGPYDARRVDELMQSVHAVLVPSVWWENSPVVIQEALRNRRPVICSNIGGMAEKVRDGIDGFHFPVGSVVDLVSLIRRLAAGPETLGQLVARMPPGPPSEMAVSAHVEYYHRQLGSVCQE